MKLFFPFILLLLSINGYCQSDSIKKNQLYISFNVGLPLYNQFSYTADYPFINKAAYSKSKPLYSFSFEHNIKHFSINFIYNYSQNEFTGASYLIQGKSLYTLPHSATVYKKLEIYQKVKYNNFQFGMGLGYNHWIKKHNISVTTSALQNIFDNVIVSSYYVENSPYNDADTTAISLKRDYRDASSERGMITVSDLGIYINFKVLYSYALHKNLFLSFSFSGSYGLLNNYSNHATPYYDNRVLGYRLNAQKIISGNVGLRYKLY